jgi:hypothetical protein
LDSRRRILDLVGPRKLRQIMDKRQFRRHLRSALKIIDAKIGNLPEDARLSGLTILDRSGFVNVTILPRNPPRKEWQERLEVRATVKYVLTAETDDRSDSLESENLMLRGIYVLRDDMTVLDEYTNDDLRTFQTWLDTTYRSRATRFQTRDEALEAIKRAELNFPRNKFIVIEFSE